MIRRADLNPTDETEYPLSFFEVLKKRGIYRLQQQKTLKYLGIHVKQTSKESAWK